MKKSLKIITIKALLMLMVFNVSVYAQDKTYKSGTVWTVSLVKTKANMSVEYLNSLKANWKAINDEAVKQGLIISYKILEGRSANPEDFDIMLMVETKDVATIQANEEKFDAIRKKIMGGEDAIQKVNQARVDVREIYGNKMFFEVVYK